MVNEDSDQNPYSSKKKQTAAPFVNQKPFSSKKQSTEDMVDQKPRMRKQAPPPPPFRTTPPKGTNDEDDTNNKGENSKESSSKENFSTKEMIKIRNGVSKQAVLKARERNERKSHNNNSNNNNNNNNNNIEATNTRQPFNVNSRHHNDDENDVDEKVIKAKTINKLSSSPDLHHSSSDNSREDENEDEDTMNASSVSVSSAKQMFSNRSTTVDKTNEKPASTTPGRLSKQLMFQESPSVTTLPSPTKSTAAPGKISKSFFEQKQNTDLKTHQQHHLQSSPQKKSKSGKWGTVQTVVNNNLRSSADLDIVVVSGTSGKDHYDEEKDIEHAHHRDSPLHSSRSRTSSQGSSRHGSYTLDLGESVNGDTTNRSNVDAEDNSNRSPVHTPTTAAKKEEEMPKGNTVSSFRDMFQNKNNNEEKSNHNRKGDEQPRPNTVSSARNLFQNTASSSASTPSTPSSIFFKNPPRLSNVVDELFFHKMNSNTATSFQQSSKPPSRLQSAGLFFEPKKEEDDGRKEGEVVIIGKGDGQEDSYVEDTVSSVNKKEKKNDEPKRPRTPQDIWVASQEEFDKKAENKSNDDNNEDGGSSTPDGGEVEERFDDVTSRTHVLLMKQAQGTGDEMPAPIQMAQILGDKDQVSCLFNRRFFF